MSRIRSIKPDYWSSEDVMSLPRDARLLFIGMWNFADDAGRIKLNPTSVKAQVFPGDDDVTRSVMASWISTIIRRGLVECYSNGETVYGQITGWHHQKIDRPQPSKYPGLQDVESVRRTFDEYSKLVQRSFATEGSEGSRGSDTQKEDAQPPAAPTVTGPDSQVASQAKAKAKAERPRNPAFDAAVEVIESEYARAFPNTPDTSKPNGALVGKLLKLTGGDAERIRAPLRLFIETPFWANQGAPLASFVGKYEALERAATKAPSGPPGRPQRARATTGKDFEDEPDLDEQMRGWANG